MSHYLSFPFTIRLSAILFIGCFLIGCGAKTSQLTGQVTYNEVPIDDGWISLLPVNGQGSQFGAKITQGTFLVEGIAPGDYQAQIVGVKPVKYVASTEEMERMSKELGSKARRADVVFAADEVPEDAVGNYAEISIAAGKQSQDFHLMPPGKSLQ